MEKEYKTIVYDYMFNYFGGDSYKGKTIMGACVQLAIKAFKNGKEIKFAEEPKKCKNVYWCDNYKVSFDKDNLFIVEKDIIVDNLFRLRYGFDKIEAEVVGYTLDYLSSLPDSERKDLPKEFQNLPFTEPMEVSGEVFREFLREHIDDFDISDNRNAQVPSISFI